MEQQSNIKKKNNLFCGKRKRGRPKETRRRTLEKDKNSGFSHGLKQSEQQRRETNAEKPLEARIS